MSDYPNPQPKDEVRVEYTARVAQLDDHGRVMAVEVDGEQSVIVVPAAATVEVLERADDPSKDLPGTQRREEHDDSFVYYVKGADCGTAWVVASSDDLTLLGRRFTDEFVAEFPRAGALPGTPAWEAERAEVEHTNEFPPERPTTVTVSARPPLHPDNEAIVLGKHYAEKVRKPKVFVAHPCAGTVEEPPDWVDKVVDVQGDHLRREDDGWIGYGGEGYPRDVKPWADHVLPMYAPYTEVKP